MKNSILIPLLCFAPALAHAGPTAGWDWVNKVSCSAIPTLVGQAGDHLDTTDVQILVDRASGSVMVEEDQVCTHVWFKDARKGETEARALGCASWLNYDVPGFAEQGYNFPVYLMPGKGGDWSRAIRYNEGKFILEAKYTVYAQDPDQNSYFSRVLPTDCKVLSN